MPATLKQRRRVFENSRITVYADHIVDGKFEVEDFVVVEPRSRRPDGFTGVVIVPVDGDSILLLKHYRHVVGETVDELPRGFIDAGEEPAAAALRELAEETGLECDPADLVDLGVVFPDTGVIAARVALFAATRCRPGRGRLDDDMGIEGVEWRPADEVRRLLDTGVLREAACCVALYRYLAWREGRTG